MLHGMFGNEWESLEKQGIVKNEGKKTERINARVVIMVFIFKIKRFPYLSPRKPRIRLEPPLLIVRKRAKRTTVCSVISGFVSSA